MDILRLIVLSFILLLFSGCDIAKNILAGDTVVETDDGKKTSCVTNMKTCMKECEIEHVPGVKVKQTYKLSEDVCKIAK